VWIILSSQYVILFSFRNIWSCWFGKEESFLEQEYFIPVVTSLRMYGTGWSVDRRQTQMQWGSPAWHQPSTQLLCLALTFTHSQKTAPYALQPGKFGTTPNSRHFFFFLLVILDSKSMVSCILGKSLRLTPSLAHKNFFSLIFLSLFIYFCYCFSVFFISKLIVVL
jgi:hypothetical protein